MSIANTILLKRKLLEIKSKQKKLLKVNKKYYSNTYL